MFHLFSTLTLSIPMLLTSIGLLLMLAWDAFTN